MKGMKHLCNTCINAVTYEDEGKDTIYVSYDCIFSDTDVHAMMVRTPKDNYVVECPRYKNAPLWERVRRKLFWWA